LFFQKKFGMRWGCLNTMCLETKQMVTLTPANTTLALAAQHFRATPFWYYEDSAFESYIGIV